LAEEGTRAHLLELLAALLQRHGAALDDVHAVAGVAFCEHRVAGPERPGHTGLLQQCDVFRLLDGCHAQRSYSGGGLRRSGNLVNVLLQSRYDRTAARSNIFASDSSSSQAIAAFPCTSGRNSQCVSPQQRSGSCATTVAVRGVFAISAISPKWSPGPSVRRSSPPTVTRAVPLSITKKPTPSFPSTASAWSVSTVRSRIVLAIRASSFFFRLLKSGTWARSSIGGPAIRAIVSPSLDRDARMRGCA